MEEDPNQQKQPDDEPEHLVLRSPAQFKALGHPMRHRIVNLLRQRPATLAHLASALGLAKGTVDHHVRVLREAGLVRLADTRQVRGGTQQRFALVSRAFQVHEDAGEGPEFLIRAALDEMLPPDPGHLEHTELRHLWLTPEEAHTLATRIEARPMEPPPEDHEGRDAYGLLVSFYRAAIPTLPPEEPE